MKYIDQSWIKPLYLGSIFLGAGGGGKPDNILLLCQKIFSKVLTVPLLDIEELAEDKVYAATGLVGSPEVVDDFFCTGQESLEALNRLSKSINSPLAGLFTLECAGVNILYPLCVAGLAKLPLINGDCIGRAFPELQMTTFHLNNQALRPFVFSNTEKKVYEFDDKDNFMLELNIRHILSQVDNIGFFATCPTKGKELQKILIPHTFTLAYEIGRVFTTYTSYEDMLYNLIKTTRNSIYGACIELFIGTVQQIENIEHKHWQAIYLKGIKDYQEETLQILTQNENLIAYKNNKLAAMVPDLISMIDIDTLKPINNNTISPGMNIAVLGTPAPLVWKTKDALNIVGPQCFGYKSPYKSLEELYFNYYY